MALNRICIFLLVIAFVSAKKSHDKKHEKKHFPKSFFSSPLKDFELLADEDVDQEPKRSKLILDEDKLEDIDINGGYFNDACAHHKCGPGKECELDEDGEPQCVCVKFCPPETDERRKVCSNHNETWGSDCDLYRMRCLCTEDLEGCKRHKYKHVHIDYYGACKVIKECTDNEMEDFPRRMRDWLFNVMQDLARRNELSGVPLVMEQEAELTNSRKWVNAVIWKFCDLDVHPHDRHISRHELFPIRAPLLAMEHCIAPFLDSCDENDDHKISLVEWGTCLGLEDNEIEDKCATIHKKKNG